MSFTTWPQETSGQQIWTEYVAENKYFKEQVAYMHIFTEIHT